MHDEVHEDNLFLALSVMETILRELSTSVELHCTLYMKYVCVHVYTYVHPCTCALHVDSRSRVGLRHSYFNLIIPVSGMYMWGIDRRLVYTCTSN